MRFPSSPNPFGIINGIAFKIERFCKYPEISELICSRKNPIKKYFERKSENDVFKCGNATQTTVASGLLHYKFYSRFLTPK